MGLLQEWEAYFIPGSCWRSVLRRYLCKKYGSSAQPNSLRPSFSTSVICDATVAIATKSTITPLLTGSRCLPCFRQLPGNRPDRSRWIRSACIVSFTRERELRFQEHQGFISASFSALFFCPLQAAGIPCVGDKAASTELVPASSSLPCQDFNEAAHFS